MSARVYEYRSEEEYIGNLLLVSSKKVEIEKKSLLKVLWIEAEEYASDTPVYRVDKDFEDFYKSVELRKLSRDECNSKISAVIQKFSEFKFKAEENLDEELFTNIIFEDSYLVEEDFSCLQLFLIGRHECHLFSWMDVV